MLSTRCGGTTTQALFENPDFLGAMRARSGLPGDNSLSFGMDAGNSENLRDIGRDGWRLGKESTHGAMVKGTFSYKFESQ